MPFTPYASNTFPAAPPDVEIIFAGLLLLIPTPRGDAGTNCCVAALQAAAHSLTVRVIDNGTLGTVSPPTGRPVTFPLTISSTNAGVTKFVSTPVATPFPGIDPTDQSTRKDFRWAVDLKALHHDARPATSPSRLQAVANMTDGILNAAKLSDPDRLAIHLVPPTGPRKDLNRIAEEIGAYITLAAAQNLTLSWVDQGTQTWALSKGGGSGQGYTIRIENLPTNDSQHDDFESYYTYGIDTGDRPFKMKFYRVLGIDVGENVDAPCMSGTTDGDGRSGS